jgi:hypothetical protein
VPDTANGGFLEYRDVVRGFVGRDDFGHIVPNKTVILYSGLPLDQSLFLPGRWQFGMRCNPPSGL